ncbi:hypothetical protein BC628DRAFT_160443 [Trametes gibbosa]|nr:hypothetical protein BC628DRAFT_160443 [Trametes gibbosa]
MLWMSEAYQRMRVRSDIALAMGFRLQLHGHNSVFRSSGLGTRHQVLQVIVSDPAVQSQRLRYRKSPIAMPQCLDTISETTNSRRLGTHCDSCPYSVGHNDDIEHRDVDGRTVCRCLQAVTRTTTLSRVTDRHDGERPVSNRRERRVSQPPLSQITLTRIRLSRMHINEQHSNDSASNSSTHVSPGAQ